MVGERITYADISICLTLRSAYENVFTADFRKAYPNVNRWFMTIVNQPGVKSVVGEISLCEKEAQFDSKKYNEIAGKPQKEKAPKKQAQPKAEKKPAAKKEAAPPAEPAAPKEKPSDPWADCDKFTMDMDSWKRFYSNNDEDKSIEHFWSIVSLSEMSTLLTKHSSLPQKSRPTTLSGRVPTNTLTNSSCLSWPPTLSEVSFGIASHHMSIALVITGSS